MISLGPFKPSGQSILPVMVAGAFDYELQPGMTLCVEALVAEDGGDFSIKLEDQVLITEDGYENLTKYPFDPALMGS